MIFPVNKLLGFLIVWGRRIILFMELIFLFMGGRNFVYSFWIIENSFIFLLKIHSSQRLFLLFLLFISMIIILFSQYYILEGEFFVFRKFLGLFVFFMGILTMRGRSMRIFLGWEGVGIISFLLIGWFRGREMAIFRRKKAIIYNRVGDFFFVLIILREKKYLYFLQENLFLNFHTSFPYLVFFGFSLVFCVIVKSAQFIFMPWLTSAMEGPTPVRALLHRRTIVVAGVFFFYSNFHFSLKLFSGGEYFIMGGGITIFVSSLAALNYGDVKKIIALSTARQLRLIIILLGVGLRDLAFLHLILHGFFKALLFLCRGRLIHGRGDNQDLRINLRGNFSSTLKKLFLWGCVGLMGLPFFGGFFRKHVIISFLSNNFIWLKIVVLILLSFSFVFTIGYRIKIISIILSFKSDFIKKKITFRKFHVRGRELFPCFFLLSLTRLVGWNFREFLSNETNLGERGFFNTYLIMFLLGGGMLTTFLLRNKNSEFLNYFWFFSKFNHGLINLIKSNFYILDKQLEKTIVKQFWKNTSHSMGGGLLLKNSTFSRIFNFFVLLVFIFLFYFFL